MPQTSPQRPLIYGLDQWPGPAATTLLATQWLFILVPPLLVLGEVLARGLGLSSLEGVRLLQRMLLVSALAQVAQVLAGHRLPGLVGPSTVLLVGMLASLDHGPQAVYGAMALGGAATALVGWLRLAGPLRRLYTPPVLASTLLLITMTLAPVLRDMLFDPATRGGGGVSFVYGAGLALAALWAGSFLRGLWSSAVLLATMVLGSALYLLSGLGPAPGPPAVGSAWGLPPLGPLGLGLEPSVLAAMGLAYLAMISNELATVESVGMMLKAPAMGARINRAVLVGGLGGLLAGLAGAPGPVTYSVSPGMLSATGSASRFTLLPVAGALVVLAAWPRALSLFGMVPPPVVGAALLFVMAHNVMAALRLLTGDEQGLTSRRGVVVGAAMTAGLVVAIMPPQVRADLPAALKPLLGNGFVVGRLRGGAGHGTFAGACPAAPEPLANSPPDPIVTNEACKMGARPR